LRISSEEISAASDMIRCASCEDDISSEKNPTTPPSTVPIEPSCAGLP
jgi:hypothetical protein